MVGRSTWVYMELSSEVEYVRYRYERYVEVSEGGRE